MTQQLVDPQQDMFLPQRQSACLNRLAAERTWETTLAVRVGPRHVGLRVDTSSTAADLDMLLQERRTPELDADAPPNFSVEMAEAGSGRTRALKLVYRDHAVVARRRDRESLLLDLLDLLGEIETTMQTSEVVVHATALARPDGTALLLPWQWHTPLLSLRSSLSRRGLDLLTSRAHVLDHTGRLVTNEVATSSLRRPRRVFDLDLWGIAHPQATAPSSLRSAAGVHAAMNTIANLDRSGAGVALRRLARLSARFAVVPFATDASTLAEVLALTEPVT